MSAPGGEVPFSFRLTESVQDVVAVMVSAGMLKSLGLPGQAVWVRVVMRDLVVACVLLDGTLRHAVFTPMN